MGRSHGTVGRTKGFWSGRYRFKTQALPTFSNKLLRKQTVIPRPPPPPHLWCMKSLDTRIFLKHRTVPLLSVRNSTESRDRRPALLILETFRTQKLFWTQGGSLTIFFGTVRQQIFDGGSWIRDFLNRYFFRYAKIIATQKRCPMMFLCTVRRKSPRRRIVIGAISLSRITVDTRIFPKLRRDPLRNVFGYARQTKIDWKSW